MKFFWPAGPHEGFPSTAPASFFSPVGPSSTPSRGGPLVGGTSWAPWAHRAPWAPWGNPPGESPRGDSPGESPQGNPPGESPKGNPLGGSPKGIPLGGSQSRQAQPVPNPGSGVPDLTPGTENQKDARRKTVQNPASRISNGAICCKLWPKTIWGRPGRFWSPFSDKMCQKPCVLHALRAARRSENSEADAKSEAEMVHGRLFGP